jgi:Na+/H+ antiporter NhaD/arsenite permease-like protein
VHAVGSIPNQMNTLVIVIFLVGYVAIATEHYINVNKAASALITGVICWTVYILNGDYLKVNHELLEHLSEISSILFFLLGAMTIVELIDAYEGFEIITNRIKTTSKRKLLWIISLLAFFLSAVLDNLTTTIVMVSLLGKLVPEKETRLLYCGMIVIAANAGGAWSPIGDVTTTMLWIGGQVTATNVITNVFIPSVVCLLIPLMILGFKMKGKIQYPVRKIESSTASFTPGERKLVFFSGIAILLMVPVFKTVTHLPPFMGMMLGLGLIWALTEIVHSKREIVDKNTLSVQYALRKIDTPSILFFFGILASVAALESIGTLHQVALYLNDALKNESLIVSTIGILSAIVDNVPLVAATMGMYSLEQFPTDHHFWQFLCYCAGTGGSILIIGSAAGVAAMGIEKIDFFWYVRKIGWLALVGYVAGAITFILQDQMS